MIKLNNASKNVLVLTKVSRMKAKNRKGAMSKFLVSFKVSLVCPFFHTQTLTYTHSVAKVMLYFILNIYKKQR